MKDKTRYSLASKERWKNWDKDKLKEKMSNMAKKKWANKAEEEKKAHALLMVKARLNKKDEYNTN